MVSKFQIFPLNENDDSVGPQAQCRISYLRTFHAAVVENGTVWTNGGKPFFAKYLAQAEIQERRDSGA